jgi:Icc protein
MLIAQLSDPHFVPDDVRLFGRLDTARYLERAVAHLNALAPDAVLITGDLTNDGDARVYAAFAAIVGVLQAPFFVLACNHDDREIMRTRFGGDGVGAGYLPESGPLCYAIDRYALRLIALDTLVPGEPSGRLGPEQLAWLDARLLEVPAKPTLVALHHPPFRTGIGHLDWSMLRDAEDLAAVIARHPQVERVLCGHVHRSIQRRFAGTLAQTAPSCAHQAKLVFGDAPATWICEPPAVLLHRWDPAGGLVSHVSPIGEYGPAGRFSDPHSTVAPQASR